MRPVGRSGDRTTAANGRPRYPAGQGSPDVTVNRRSALRVSDPILDSRGNFQNGEATVLVNGQPLVAQGDDASCARCLDEASPDVIVGRGNIGSPGVPPGILFHIHVDANRDGRVDDDYSRNGTWEGGRAKLGAVLPVNCDDEVVAPRPNVGGAYELLDDVGARVPVEDYQKPDRTLTVAADLLDVAAIDIRRDPNTAGRSTAGWKLVLKVDREHKIRIFDRRAVGAVPVIGPGKGSRHEITNIDRDRYELAMEGTQYPGRHPFAGRDLDPVEDFDGEIVITLEVWDPAGVLAHTEICRVRATPWVMFNHFDPTDEVIVVHAISESPINNNEEMRAGLTAALPSGVKLTIVQNMDDRWAQDVMEPGYSSLARTSTDPASWSHPVVLRSARNRESYLEMMAKQMCGPGFGFAQAQTPGVSSSLDSFGNLECTPPYGDYPFGRIVYGMLDAEVPRFLEYSDGTRDPDPGMAENVVRFLQSQLVQAPIGIETGWLTVGHVDEILSFLPMRDARLGFRVVYASAYLGLEILEDLVTQVPPETTMRWGTGGTTSIELPLRRILGELPHLRALTRFVDGRIGRAKDRLKTALGLTEGDFVRLPVVFNGFSRRHGLMVCDPAQRVRTDLITTDGAEFGDCIAQTPGVVNGLVVTRGEPTLQSRRDITYIMPRPYGPRVGGRCAFEERVRRNLGDPAVTGVTPMFIDDFFSYHTMAGEVHCGTNTVRKPPVDRFWWESPLI